MRRRDAAETVFDKREKLDLLDLLSEFRLLAADAIKSAPPRYKESFNDRYRRLQRHLENLVG